MVWLWFSENRRHLVLWISLLPLRSKWNTNLKRFQVEMNSWVLKCMIKGVGVVRGSNLSRHWPENTSIVHKFYSSTLMCTWISNCIILITKGRLTPYFVCQLMCHTITNKILKIWHEGASFMIMMNRLRKSKIWTQLSTKVMRKLQEQVCPQNECSMWVKY